MADALFTKGDTAPDLTGTCTSVLAGVSTPANLTGATLALHIAKPSGAVLTATATIVSATAGEWAYTWAPGDLSEVGDHTVEVQVTYSGGRVQTFGPQTFMVGPQFA
jgi:hypothetical protein